MTHSNRPRFPLRITYSDGSTTIVEDEEEVRCNLEWLDTADPMDPVTVIDKLGRPVRLKVEFLQIEKLELQESAGETEEPPSG